MLSGFCHEACLIDSWETWCKRSASLPQQLFPTNTSLQQNISEGPQTLAELLGGLLLMGGSGRKDIWCESSTWLLPQLSPTTTTTSLQQEVLKAPNAKQVYWRPLEDSWWKDVVQRKTVACLMALSPHNLPSAEDYWAQTSKTRRTQKDLWHKQYA